MYTVPGHVPIYQILLAFYARILFNTLTQMPSVSGISFCSLLSTCILSLQDAYVISYISTAGSERKHTSDNYTEWLNYACTNALENSS